MVVKFLSLAQKRITLLFLAVIMSFSVIPAPHVSAVSTDCDKDYLSLNDIIFYNPCVSCSPGRTSVTSDIKIEKTEVIDSIYTYLTSTALSTNGGKPLTAAQAAGVMGNFYAESGFNPGAIENTSREDKGHGLAQWTFGRWNNLSNFAEQQGKPWNSVSVQLDFLKTELESSEKAVLNDNQFKSDNPSDTAKGWRVAFERADPALAHDDKRIGAAITIFNLYGGSSASCEPDGAVVAGNLVKTAINFALQSPATNGMTDKSQARDTYQVGKEKYNPSVDWTDCGGFVAASIFASGVDPNYPNVLVSTQRQYVKSHPDKYMTIDNPSLDQLQPGDILFVDGHTTLYTGEAEYPMVDASLYERVPSVRTIGGLHWMLNQSTSMAARLLK